MHATNLQVAAVEMVASGNGRHAESNTIAAAGLPILQAKGEPMSFGVRALNVVIASTALLMFSPLIVLLAAAIKLTSPGPVLYTQDRIGLDRRNGARPNRPASNRARDLGGRPFRIYKFRTMHVGAETKTGPVWATPADNRVTRLGRFLRRTRLDELPQLWNVVRGEMNIVGPRPERPTMVAYLSQEIEDYRLRHKVPPGITGWAQINQSYDTTLDSVRCKLLFDLDYIHRRSVLFDMRIMLGTIPAVLKKRGGW